MSKGRELLIEFRKQYKKHGSVPQRLLLESVEHLLDLSAATEDDVEGQIMAAKEKDFVLEEDEDE